MKSTIRLFANDCVIYRKIINDEDLNKLQKDFNWPGECAVENAMKINPSKRKAIRFTRAKVKDPLNYSFNGHINTGSEQLKIFTNNLTQRLELGGSSQLRGERALAS